MFNLDTVKKVYWRSGLTIYHIMVLPCRQWLLTLIAVLVFCSLPGTVMAEQQNIDVITLPAPKVAGEVSVEALLQQRRSVRDFREEPVSLAELGQLLWAAQGVTRARGFRTAPSAGALFPLELYVVTGRVDDLAAGVYHYDPHNHQLQKISNQDERKALAWAAAMQFWLKDAAAVLVFTGVYERTTRKYGKRGERYVHMEVGHAVQNVYLQAEALGLGTVMVGAFSDTIVANILDLPDGVSPLALMPVGKK